MQGIAIQLGFSALRWACTAAGAYLATKGFTDSGTAQQVSGSLLTLASLGWSMIHHSTTVSVPISAVTAPQDPPH